MRETLFSMQKRKIPGPNGLIMEFYEGFNELIKEDLLLTIKEHLEKC